MQDMTTSGGGLHPGRPVIWPTSKEKPQSQQAVPEPTQVKPEQAQKLQQQQQSQQAQQMQQAAQQAQQAVKAQQQAKQQVTKQFTVQQLQQHMAQQNIQTSSSNMQLAATMLNYGLPVNSTTFSEVSNLLSASDNSAISQEAAVLLQAKGVNAPQATQTLAAYLKQNPQLASQLSNVSSNVADLQAALGMTKGVLQPEVMQALTALLSQFDEKLNKTPQNYKFSGNNSSNRTELLNDMRAMKSMLSGVQENASFQDNVEGQILQSSISDTIENLGRSIDNLTSQSFLSQQSGKTEANYSYYQVPNSMAAPPQTAEIVIQRDEKGGKKIDPNNTKIILKLDTLNLGAIVINMSVKNKKVEFMFSTQGEGTKKLISKESGILTSALSDKDFVATKLQVHVNPTLCAVRAFIMPFLSVEDTAQVNIST